MTMSIIPQTMARQWVVEAPTVYDSWVQSSRDEHIHLLRRPTSSHREKCKMGKAPIIGRLNKPPGSSDREQLEQEAVSRMQMMHSQVLCTVTPSQAATTLTENEQIHLYQEQQQLVRNVKRSQREYEGIVIV
jgi:hypothetical protein